VPTVTEVIYGFGHPNVLALHRGTIEFTKDPHLTLMGDCVVVVSLNRGLLELSEEFKQALRQPSSKVTIKIEVTKFLRRFLPRAQAAHINRPNEIVVRKSEFTSTETLAVHADKAAKTFHEN
jgi:hypothetical protein